MKIIDLAIVIPTLNEEKYIGTLLDSIFEQSVWPKEIVVVDVMSKDKTQQVVEKRQKVLPQLKFIQIPRYSISRQRNLGASQTTSAHILFLDADMKLQDSDCLEKYFKEVQAKSPDIAVAYILPLSSSWIDKTMFFNLKYIIKASKPIWPWAPGMNIYVKRASFNKINGFDEEIRVAEDVDLVQRMVKKGLRFEFLDTPKVHTSVRRFIKEGRRKYLWKLVKGFVSIQRKGFKQAEIDYQFGDWDNLKKEKGVFEKLIKEIEKRRFTQAILKIIKK